MLHTSKTKNGRPKVAPPTKPVNGSAGAIVVVKCSDRKHKGMFQRHVSDDLSTIQCPICLKVGTLKPVK